MLIKRKYDPFKGKWALPGGHLDEGETLEDAAIRELKEETGITVSIVELRQVHTYSKADRDLRGRYITTSFVHASTSNLKLSAESDAADIKSFALDDIMNGTVELAFDHLKIIKDAWTHLLSTRI